MDFLRMEPSNLQAGEPKRMVFQAGAAVVTAVAGNNCSVAVPFVQRGTAQIEAEMWYPSPSPALSAITSNQIPTIKESGLISHIPCGAFVVPAGLVQIL